MVVSDTTRAQAKRDKAPVTEASIPPEVVDASKISQADPGPVDRPPVRPEAYVTVDALKNFVSTLTDVIMQQASEQVKKVMEAASSARPPFPGFEYVPTEACGPSCRRDPVASPYRGERMQEAPHVGRDRWS